MGSKKLPLGDCITLCIDHRGKTPAKLGGDWAEAGYRALSAKNIKTGTIVQPDAIRFVDEALYRKWMPEEIERGDILVTSEAPFGQIYIWDSNEKIVLSQRLFGVRPNKDICDPHYLYYWMCGQQFQGDMRGRATGTTVIGLRQPALLSCEVILPDLDTQRRIASTLQRIDGKMDVNRRANDYLLELCAARYDEARRESVDGSESRFEPGVLTDLIEVNYGKDHKHLADGPYPVYGSGGLMRHVEKYLYDGESALIPRKGTLNNVMLVDGRFWTVDTMFFTKELSIGAARYAYFILKRLDLASMNAGSAVPSMTTKILSAIPVSIPDDDLLQELKEWTDPLFAQIRLNERENEQLEAMRDALLPKLMSGEIDVSGVELPTPPNNHLSV